MFLSRDVLFSLNLVYKLYKIVHGIVWVTWCVARPSITSEELRISAIFGQRVNQP